MHFQFENSKFDYTFLLIGGVLFEENCIDPKIFYYYTHHPSKDPIEIRLFC